VKLDNFILVKLKYMQSKEINFIESWKNEIIIVVRKQSREKLVSKLRFLLKILVCYFFKNFLSYSCRWFPWNRRTLVFIWYMFLFERSCSSEKPDSFMINVLVMLIHLSIKSQLIVQFQYHISVACLSNSAYLHA
jgi:hypothetical protein